MSTVLIKCPNCSFSKEVEKSAIPPKTASVRCIKCGQTFPFRVEEKTEVKETKQEPAFTPPSPSRRTPDRHVPSAYKISFHGNGGTLFGIHVVNLLLTIATLGIYKFWGRVKVRSYIYSQTELMGDRFSYHGTGKELFIGWLKAMGIFLLVYLVVSGLGMLHPLFSILLLPAILTMISFGMIGGMKYRLSRSSWRGIFFSFRGGYKEGIRRYLTGMFLTVITLGLYYPFFHTKMREYWTENSYFGNMSFRYDGNGREMFGSFIAAVFLNIPTLGLYWLWYSAKVQRYDWEHTSAPGLRFKSTITGGDLLFLYLTDLLILVFTIGLAYPWISVRNTRFKFNFIIIEGDADFDRIRQDAQKAGTIGEGIADYMDIDGGFFDIGSVF